MGLAISSRRRSGDDGRDGGLSRAFGGNGYSPVGESCLPLSPPPPLSPKFSFVHECPLLMGEE